MWREFEIQRDDATMSVKHRRGNGSRWILLLHGACADRGTFDQQLTAFDESCDILLPNLRGHGSSTLRPGASADFDAIVEDLTALIEWLGSPRITVIGHSFGSHLAQELAHRRPDLIDGLILIGCYDQHTERDTGERARVAITSSVVRILPWTWFARFSANIATTDPVIRRYLYDTHLAAGRPVFLALGRSGSAAKHPVTHYPVPLLLIRGEREYSRHLDTVYQRIAARSDRARTVIIPNAGHLCHQEDPATVNAALLAYLAE